MKKILLKIPKSPQGSTGRQVGFTLIELLIVISIIAILSIIGLTVFTGVQKNARDARRRTDIDAIATALEVNKTPTEYQLFQPGWFAGGSIPFDPKQQYVSDWNTSGCGDPNAADFYKKVCWYCINVNGSGTKTSPALCDSSAWSPGDGNWTTPANSWWVCANLENSPGFYCRGSSQ